MRQAGLIALFVSLLFVAVSIPQTARADGIIYPDPPPCMPERYPPPPCLGPSPCPPSPPNVQLAIRYHHVTVTIQDQVAITRVDQVFYNPNSYEVEGTYLFPLPKEAAVSDFSLWIDGKAVKGEILEAEQARQKYEDIVRNLKDPALLEYADRGAVQAHIFPIPPGGERRIALEYSQALTSEGGLVRYVYPLNTEKFSLYPLDEVTISVDIRSHLPIRAVYSPSHQIDVSREGEGHVIAGYEAKNVLPDQDFALYYSIGEQEAFHLMTYRDAQDPSSRDGFFTLLLAPKVDAGQQGIIPKDVILVLDRSGSMDGEKFRQAQEALKYVLDHLNAEDRFNIISFSTGVESYAQGLRSADEANEARGWVNGLSAQGSTDINRALLEAVAMSDRERPTYLIFLTDGLPTQGETDSQKILDNLSEAAPKNVRLFAFGVGYDVDTILLDSLSQEHHGTSTYVLPDDPLDELVSGFYAKISTPVLTDLKLDFGEVGAYDVYPSPLPDLFRGSQIVVVGRYHSSGRTTVILSGNVNGEPTSFDFTGQEFSPGTDPEETDTLATIPRLWATRKIGYLLNQIRLNGADPETVDQIVKLSIRYGIVTPYTSYLVTEPLPLGEAEQERIAGEQLNQYQNMPAAPVSGQAAVEKAAGQGGMANADTAMEPMVGTDNTGIHILGSHTFILKEGTWIDTAFDPDNMKTVKVAFLSDDYFKLVRAYPELGDAFTLGERVIALAGGLAYDVVDADTPVEPLDLNPTNTPSAPTQPVAQPAGNSPEENTNPVDGHSPLPCSGGVIPLFGVGFFGLFTAKKEAQRWHSAEIRHSGKGKA